MMLVERERTVDLASPDSVEEPVARSAVDDDGSAISWAVVPPLPMTLLDGLSDEVRRLLEQEDA